MPVQEVVLADTPDALARALDLLEGLDVVGVDVERADWDRYWRAAALVQVGGDGRVGLVDPLLLPDLTDLSAYLAERTVVLHAMDNDLGPLATLGVIPPRIEDTSLAAAVLGLPLGLETLLADLLGVELPGDKSAMQRADWEARPLRPEMLDYAAGDVADLPALWTALEARLDEAGRHEWYRQELEAVRALPPAEQRRDWTRTKGVGRLDPASRGRLRSLWDRREELAKETDTAPSRIAADKLLVDLAVRPPTTTRELGRRGLRRAAVRDFGAALLAAIGAAQHTTVEAGGGVAGRQRTRPPTEEDRTHVDQLRVLRSARAEQLGIDPGVLCPSRTLMGALLTDPVTPAELRDGLGLRPWQWEQLGWRFSVALGLDGEGRPPEPAAPPTAAPEPTSEPEQVHG